MYKPYWDEHVICHALYDIEIMASASNHTRTEKQIASNEIQLHVQLIFMLTCHECGHLI